MPFMFAGKDKFSIRCTSPLSQKTLAPVTDSLLKFSKVNYRLYSENNTKIKYTVHIWY